MKTVKIKIEGEANSGKTELFNIIAKALAENGYHKIAKLNPTTESEDSIIAISDFNRVELTAKQKSFFKVLPVLRSASFQYIDDAIAWVNKHNVKVVSICSSNRFSEGYVVVWKDKEL